MCLHSSLIPSKQLPEGEGEQDLSFDRSARFAPEVSGTMNIPFGHPVVAVKQRLCDLRVQEIKATGVRCLVF